MKRINWHNKIGSGFEFQLSSGGQKFKILSVNGNHVVLEREDSWTFTAMNPVIDEHGSISWDYSIGGRFTNNERLKAFLNAGSGEYVTIISPHNDVDIVSGEDY
jgi:hypothetical protein